MIDIVLDTNVFSADPNRKSPQFKAIKRLAQNGLLKLHVPYVVEREFQTQQYKKHKESLDQTLSGLAFLSNRGLSTDTLEKISAFKKELNDATASILEDSEKEIISWLESINAERIPLCVEQANEALEAYFQGKPPLKEPKNRKDIPDSFVARAIEKIQPNCETLHLVTNDKRLRQMFDSRPSIRTHETLSSFVSSDLIQDALLDLDLLENYEQLISAIESYEGETENIKSVIEESIGEKIVWGTIKGETIPDDNEEATINAYGEAENIELNFEQAAYFGNGQVGIPFSLEIEVQAHFYIFKSDYYAMELNYSVTDHNDHYYEAESDFTVIVEGMATLSIDKNEIDFAEMDKCIDIESIEISEIKSITMPDQL